MDGRMGGEVVDVSDRDAVFIAGEWVRSQGSKVTVVVDPADERPIARVAMCAPEDVDRAMSAARSTIEGTAWRLLAPADRAELLLELRDALAARRESLLDLVVGELGVPIAQAGATHVDQPLATLAYYAALVGETW